MKCDLQEGKRRKFNKEKEEEGGGEPGSGSRTEFLVQLAIKKGVN